MAKKEESLNIETLQQNLIATDEQLKSVQLENSQLKKQLEETKTQLSECNNNLAKALEDKEKASSNTDKQLEQIEQIKAERDDLSQKLTILNDLVKSNTPKLEAVDKLQEELSKANEKITKLKEKYEQLCDSIDSKPHIELSMFAYLIAQKLAEKLSAKYHKEVTLSMIFENYILRYNIQDKWTEWFHPFVLDEADIMDCAQQINPNIQTKAQLKRLLNID